MKTIICLLFVCICLWSFPEQASAQLKAYLEPQEPVVGQDFYLVFQVIGEIEDEPFISFDPGAIKVLSKDTRIPPDYNNRLKEYIYTLRTEKAGMLFIRNVVIEQGGQKKRFDDIYVNILREKKRPPQVFILAIPTKKVLYKGEGFNIDFFSITTGSSLVVKSNSFQNLKISAKESLLILGLKKVLNTREKFINDC
jgi:hypothetical protein